MKKLIFLIIILVIGVFLSPYYTLYQIKSAYENGDYAKAVSYVDFGRVQINAKTFCVKLCQVQATLPIRL